MESACPLLEDCCGYVCGDLGDLCGDLCGELEGCCGDLCGGCPARCPDVRNIIACLHVQIAVQMSRLHVRMCRCLHGSCTLVAM